MSLTKGVRFRFLSAQLTSTETHQFVNKLLNHNQGNILISALFSHIINDTNQQQSDGDYINSTISNIILSRKKKPKPIPIQNIKLDQLPKRLIGVIASFLERYDYFNFSKTNRFVYLGCNSPNLLQQLDLSEIENYSSVNLKLYPSLKHLGLTLTQCEELIPSITDLSIMNELKSIDINAQFGNDVHIDNFLTLNCINNDNITQLTCGCFGDYPDAQFPAQQFMKLLTKFPNIQYLKLYCAYVDIDVNKIKDLYPNLKGLAIIGDFIECSHRELINTFGNNLDFFALCEYGIGFDYNLQNINFSQLEELVLVTPKSKSISDVLKTAKKLKKIGIFATCENHTLMTSKEIKTISKSILILCKSLQFVQYRDNGKFLTSALDGIEKGLFETKNWKRNQMKIDIVTECNNEFEPINFIFNISKIIKLLDCSEINDFMFIWKLRGFNKEMDTSILLQELKSKCSSINIVHDLFENALQLVFSNNDCKINGFDESWK